ncbi:MAG: aminotransferase class I/II-fold pyridoxal phosphate-dependent enzyme [Deltaproteobacteria bacterium]|nr:aminotransferase class I/II-fold pyridoxal phosphate-dependent enzyme [Deltaproteobacteria bacterium]
MTLPVKTKRIFLSPPHMDGGELRFIREAFESNYIAPLGPQVDAFEREFAEYTGIRHCVAVSSGTAAMHLALRCLGVGQGDEVFASTLTFIGSVTPIVFQGAVPVFIDSELETWNMDPYLLEEELERCARKGRLPKAVVPTDLYGQCCDLPRIMEICKRYEVPVICDSAESLGARYLPQRRKDAKSKLATDPHRHTQTSKDYEKTEVGDQGSDVGEGQWVHAGKGAKAAVYSFNGNKIITTSGGGMLASDDEGLIEHARRLSQQAREDFPHYEHVEIGYNYRLSNVLAAIGRGQLRVLDDRVRRKREIFEYYRGALGGVAGIEFMPEPEWSRANRWLTVILIMPEVFGADREAVRLALEKGNIEARPVWKPMHLQPVFGYREQRAVSSEQKYPVRVVGGEVAEDLFERGLCLPSGTAMTEGNQDRVIETILKRGRQ